MRTIFTLLVLSTAVFADTITWGTPTTISGASDVSTNGTSVSAVNINGATTTVNGVTFTGLNISAGSPPYSSGNFTFLDGGLDVNTSSSDPLFTVLPSSYQSLIGTGVAIFGNTRLTLSGLTMGQKYEFQAWSNGNSPFPDSLGIADGTSQVLVPMGNAAGIFGSYALGSFVLGTFTADAVSKSLILTTVESAFFNAFQLRAIQTNSAVPEPASTALIALGLGALAIARKRA